MTCEGKDRSVSTMAHNNPKRGVDIVNQCRALLRRDDGFRAKYHAPKLFYSDLAQVAKSLLSRES